MGRRKKQTDLEDAIEAKPPSNGYDAAKTKSFVSRIENLHAEIATIMGTALNECKTVHADIKLVYDEAKEEAGIPKKALKKVVKARELERKAAAVREDLEAEDQDTFDMIRQALGDLADTPLGQSAMPEDMRDPPFAAPPVN